MSSTKHCVHAHRTRGQTWRQQFVPEPLSLNNLGFLFRQAICKLTILLAVGAIVDAASAASAACPSGAIDVHITIHQNDGQISSSSIEYPSTATADDTFMSFVTRLLTSLPEVLERAKLCRRNEIPVMIAQFVYVPLYADVFNASSVVTEPVEGYACAVESPWVRLGYDPRSAPPLRVVFIWNERQILFDQAVLAGSPPVTRQLEPVKTADFMELARQYEAEEVSLRLSAKPGLPIASRIPPDILWFFRKRSWPDQLTPITLQGVMKQALPRQLLLTDALVKSCLEAKHQRNDFATILDAVTEVPLNYYVIDSFL